MPKMAVIDNDFLDHLGELRNHDDAFDLIVKFFDALDYKVYIHPLVYKFEKKPGNNPLIERLFNEDVIIVSDFFDVLETKPTDKSRYELIVKQVYREFTGKTFPVNDLYNEWKRHDDLGEVYSAAMCVVLECDYLLSDDNKAIKYIGNITKRVAQKFINVYSRQQCCDLLKADGLMSRKELKLIGHKVRC